MNEKIHERGIKLLSAYITFVIGLLLAVAFKSHNIEYSSLIISLASISLPSLISIIFLDYVVRVRQERKNSVFRGLAFFLGFLPSFSAIALLVASFSWIASISFTLLTIFWLFVLDVVTYIGFKDKTSEV